MGEVTCEGRPEHMQASMLSLKAFLPHHGRSQSLLFRLALFPNFSSRGCSLLDDGMSAFTRRAPSFTPDTRYYIHLCNVDIFAYFRGPN